MKIVTDANILFSLARPDSVAGELVSRYRINLFSPKYVLSELSDHTDEITRKTCQPYNRIMERLKGLIFYSEPEEYAALLVQAASVLKDVEDAPYLALAMKLKAPIWSNDKHLKEQEKIPVFTTKELVELLTSV